MLCVTVQPWAQGSTARRPAGRDRPRGAASRIFEESTPPTDNPSIKAVSCRPPTALRATRPHFPKP